MSKNLFKNYHIRNTIHLAWPLIATQVGHILTGMVDNIFLGRIGSTQQAAGILSNNLFMLLMVFAIGFSYATTPLTTSAHEKNDLFRKASLFKNSLFLNFTVALVCFIFWFLGSGLLNHMQQPEEVVLMAVPYFNVIIFSILPVSLFFACKQYCEGLSNTRMALIISLTGNAINVVLNYLLIYGEFGFPELGYMGAAWASFYARLFMGIAFVILIFKSPVTRSISKVYTKVKVNWRDLADLWKIGFNTAMQFTFEVAAFVIAGLMAGVFGKEQIDAHGIALNIAAFTYMFASGISSAVTIRVGIYKANENWLEIKHASTAAFKLVLWVMGFFGASFIIFNKFLPMAFSTEENIIEMASGLLIIAAMFQLFDGMQVTIIGILRGLEDVRIPTLVTLIGYWIIALPLAYFLAFTLKMEITGIWIALLVSLLSVAFGLYWRLNYLIKTNLLLKSSK